MKRLPVLMLLVLIVPATATAGSWMGKVVEVIDGDTLVVLKEGRRIEVCLHGVDAPEKDQPFGVKAKAFAAKLVVGKRVTIEDTGKERGCQIVAQVYLGKTHLNVELLKAGLAWHLRDRDGSKAFTLREGGARKDRRGLWRDSDPVAPWSWRLQKAPPLNLNAPAQTKVLTMPLGELSALPRSKERACRADQDCVFARKAPCACPPCTPAKGQVVNRTTFKRLLFHWSRRTCSAQKCTKCSVQARAVCLKGQCALRVSTPVNRRLSCKTDKDCVFRFRTPCECPPCGETRRQASNLETFNKIKETWSIKVPRCQTCKRCKEPTKWLGSRAVCVKGQCEVR